jgi:hypothetical protein
MSPKISKEQEKMQTLMVKFTDIQTMRDRILGDSTTISNDLKKMLAIRKATSPEVLMKNIRSISSFLENFNRMIENLGTKLGSLAGQIDKIRNDTEKITFKLKSV